MEGGLVAQLGGGVVGDLQLALGQLVDLLGKFVQADGEGVLGGVDVGQLQGSGLYVGQIPLALAGGGGAAALGGAGGLGGSGGL